MSFSRPSRTRAPCATSVASTAKPSAGIVNTTALGFMIVAKTASAAMPTRRRTVTALKSMVQIAHSAMANTSPAAMSGRNSVTIACATGTKARVATKSTLSSSGPSGRLRRAITAT